MKQDTLLVQCQLVSGSIRTTAWLEAEKAQKGIQVLSSDALDKSDEASWWTILEVGSKKVAYSKIAGRKASDIWENPVNRMRGNK